MGDKLSAVGQSLAQKIIAKAVGKEYVTPGEVEIANIDLAMIHDSGGPRRVKPILDRLGVDVWSSEKIVVVTDHYVPEFNDETKAIQKLTRDWVKTNNIRSFYDQMGICHVVVPENGHLKPGMFVVGGDSHSPTGGAFGAYMFGIGATEMAGVLATGEIWIKVPETIRINWSGKLSEFVTAKDMMLYACGKLGMDGGKYQAVEFSGSAISTLDMQERMTISNMTAELGGQAGIIAPDDVTKRYLKNVSSIDIDIAPWFSDQDAKFLESHQFDATGLPPQVAAPHSPANSIDITETKGTKVDVAYIGACTGAKLSDLRMAASVLKGKKLASGVRLLVAPASLKDQETAKTEGIMQIFEDIGASILPNSCGICAGYGSERLGEDIVCISSTARNFQGRMGALSSGVYLSSPYTVAASAISGEISDPRNFIGIKNE
ncbi:MAG: 3-isopropylmalate dehydratase large subunit [Rhodobacteraceae bacterium]|nr:3-isopropylmalate dehydratase large subunit [Paracoccaceae bacterium]